MVVLAELYSMADSSTTVRGIPILIAGGYRARYQLHAGIRYIPIISIPVSPSLMDIRSHLEMGLRFGTD